MFCFSRIRFELRIQTLLSKVLQIIFYLIEETEANMLTGLRRADRLPEKAYLISSMFSLLEKEVQ